ncbi:SDR family oxidoreductase [Streptomyces sp. NPDC102351]|uniref:SDR family oxidoreductase n=1 Tax=Streptomyces sp. NPDC102351 TaxID=3366158 RepID=UPI00380D1F05
MIVVTGATGKLGRLVVESLLTRVPSAEVGVSVRDPRKAQDLAERGVRVRQGSFAAPGSLAHAFEGATQVLLISVDKMGEECVTQHRIAIEAAVTAGARRILYTGHAGGGPASRFQACRDHAATEDVLRASGVPYTVLRNGFYASSALDFLAPGLESGRLALPVDGPVSWTAHADLAEATAAILADEGCFEGATPPLTSGVALTFDDIARIAGEVTGRTVTRVVAPDEEFCAGLTGRGVPDELAGQLLGIFEASRAGEFATVDPTLKRLIGREPISLAEQLRERVARG